MTAFAQLRLHPLHHGLTRRKLGRVPATVCPVSSAEPRVQRPQEQNVSLTYADRVSTGIVFVPKLDLPRKAPLEYPLDSNRIDRCRDEVRSVWTVREVLIRDDLADRDYRS